MSASGLKFEEKRGVFLNPMKDVEKGAKISNGESYVSVYCCGGEIAQIRENGDVVYGERRPDLTIRRVTISPAQRKQIDRVAEEFLRKCGIEMVVAQCEEVLTLKQFPMVAERPIKDPVQFYLSSDYADMEIWKGGGTIGILRISPHAEFGRVIMYSRVQHTGLSDADKTDILAKCREIVGAHAIE